MSPAGFGMQDLLLVADYHKVNLTWNLTSQYSVDTYSAHLGIDDKIE